MVTYHRQMQEIHLYSEQHSGNQMELSYLMWCPCSPQSANYIVYQKDFGLITVHLSIHVNYGLLSSKVKARFHIRREMKGGSIFRPEVRKGKPRLSIVITEGIILVHIFVSCFHFLPLVHWIQWSAFYLQQLSRGFPVYFCKFSVKIYIIQINGLSYLEHLNSIN